MNKIEEIKQEMIEVARDVVGLGGKTNNIDIYPLNSWLIDLSECGEDPNNNEDIQEIAKRYDVTIEEILSIYNNINWNEENYKFLKENSDITISYDIYNDLTGEYNYLIQNDIITHRDFTQNDFIKFVTSYNEIFEYIVNNIEKGHAHPCMAYHHTLYNLDTSVEYFTDSENIIQNEEENDIQVITFRDGSMIFNSFIYRDKK